MKKIYLICTLLSSIVGLSQAGAPAAPYYNGFDWNLTGMPLKSALATKITDTHTNFLTYAEAEDAIKIVDLDPADATNTNLLLLYGFSNNICNYVSESNFGNSTDDNDHRRRHKEADSGDQNCAWNREHTYPRALGTPNLQDNEANADVHHVRASDVARNGMRDNDRFFDGSGNSFENGILWYPGDEWKGDVARMMMYMYLRYGNQCLPTGVAQTGITTMASDANMVQLFLEWNAEDPVSQYEDNRNTYLGNTSNTYGQGNRNPFIDNPYLATVIWGGPVAQNRWPGTLSTNDFAENNFSIYPNPSNGNFRIDYDSTIGDINVEIYSTVGQKVFEKQNINDNTVSTSGLQTGVYFVKINKDSKSILKKIVIN